MAPLDAQDLESCVEKNFRTSLEGILEKVRKGLWVVSEFGRGLSHIRVPTLITVGRYDHAPVKLVERIYNGIQTRSWWSSNTVEYRSI